MGTIRQWYASTYDEAEAENMPKNLTWNKLLRALERGEDICKVLNVGRASQAPGRCISKLAETIRVSEDWLWNKIKNWEEEQ